MKMFSKPNRVLQQLFLKSIRDFADKQKLNFIIMFSCYLSVLFIIFIVFVFSKLYV